MKYVRQFAFTLFTLFLCSPIWSQGHGATGRGIATPGSPHNLTSYATPSKPGKPPATPTLNERKQICGICHVPHDHERGRRYQENGLLWDATLRQATYIMFSSATEKASEFFQPTGYSKMCLSCHDGVAAASSFDRVEGEAVFASTSHPVSVVYNPALNPNLEPVTKSMGGSGTIDDILQDSVVQCSSCHDVHDQPGETIRGTALLRMSLADSSEMKAGLCLGCHLDLEAFASEPPFQSFNCSLD